MATFDQFKNVAAKKCFPFFLSELQWLSSITETSYPNIESDTHYERKPSTLNNFFRKKCGTYYIIPGTRENDIIELTRSSLTSLTNKKEMPAIRGTSEGSETSKLEYSTRRIQIFQIFRVPFCWDHVFTCFKNKRSKNDHRKFTKKLKGTESNAKDQ